MKRALVLSGGGSRGAYQVGVIQHLLGERAIDYDIITGISVGALNGSYLSMFNRGDGNSAARGLLNIWKKVNDRAIYKKWFFGRLAALWRPSVYNSKPLQNLLDENLDTKLMRSSGKKLIVGAVSMTTGRYRTWDESDDDIVDAVKASSAFPGMFLPVEIDGEVWVDGGIREVAPVNDAIQAGATHIDVILNQPRELPVRSADTSAVGSISRIFETMLSEATSNDLKRVELYNEILRYQHLEGKKHIHLNVLEPKRVLIQDALNFSPTKIGENIKQGHLDAAGMDWSFE